MNIWLTGSGGFLGTRLGRRLSEEGHLVLGLSRRPDPHAAPNEVLDLSSPRTPEELAVILKKWGDPDAVIHAAARVRGSDGFREFLRANLLTTANLVDFFASRPKVRFVHLSTLAVFGRAESVPVREDDPVHPTHPYTLTKLWAEQLVRNSALGERALVLRLPSLFGAGQEDSFIDGLARPALAGKDLDLLARGEIVRDGLHVDDAVEGVVQGLNSPPDQGYTCLNLGCGRPIPVVEWARALVQALGSSSRVVPVDRPSPQAADLYADITRARDLIGFAPTPLKETMEIYARELQAQS